MKSKDSADVLVNTWDDMDHLITQLRNGDKDAFAQIFTRYFGMLCLYGEKKMTNRSSVIQEIVSDAFLSLWKKREDFYAAPSMESYLFTCVKNDCIDHLRSEKRKLIRQKLLSAEEHPTDENDSGEITPEMLSAFYEEVKKLPAQQREVVNMYIEGYKTRQISEKLGITTKTVQNYRLIALNSLQERLSLRLKLSKMHFILTFL